MDRGAWWTTVERVAKSQTKLSNYAHCEMCPMTLSGEDCSPLFTEGGGHFHRAVAAGLHRGGNSLFSV